MAPCPPKIESPIPLPDLQLALKLCFRLGFGELVPTLAEPEGLTLPLLLHLQLPTLGQLLLVLFFQLPAMGY